MPSYNGRTEQSKPYAELYYYFMQVAAGGKLFNIVVDTENTGKQLLQNGGLRRRVTIIPLNKIQSNPIPTGVRNAAVRLVSIVINSYICLSPHLLLCQKIIVLSDRWAREMLK